MTETLIVVPVHNAVEITLACLDSIAVAKHPLDQVLVVDNGSTDETVPAVNRRFPQIQVISQSNRGYADAVNVGLSAARQRDFQFTWILNNDTIVQQDTGQVLRMFMEQPENSHVAACNPVTYYAEQPGVINFAGGWIDRENWTSGHLEDPSRGAALLADEPAAAFLTGSALFVRNSALRDIGMFDARFFMYWEDVDFTIRLVARGWQMRLVPAACLLHRGLGSTGGDPSVSTFYYYARNRFLLWRKFTRRHRLKVLRRMLDSWTEEFALPWSDEIDYRKWAIIKGITDGMLGRFGKRNPLMSPDRTRVAYGAMQRILFMR